MGKTSEEHGRIEVRSTYSEYHRFESRAINLVASESEIVGLLPKNGHAITFDTRTDPKRTRCLYPPIVQVIVNTTFRRKCFTIVEYHDVSSLGSSAAKFLK